MKKKIISILVIMLFFASIFGTVNAEKTCSCKDSNESNTNINTQSTNREIYLGIGEIMGNGKQDESYATATCKEGGDIVCPIGEKITFIIEYDIKCHGIWDKGQVTAKVNGEEKPAAETEGNMDGEWTWTITCTGDGVVNWEITCKLWDGWTKKDYCSTTRKIREPEPDLHMVWYGGVNKGYAGEYVYLAYEIKNIGEAGSILNWRIIKKSGEFFTTYSEGELNDIYYNWELSPQSGTLVKGKTQRITLGWIIPKKRQWDGKIEGNFKIQNNKDKINNYVDASVCFRRWGESFNKVDLSSFFLLKNFLQIRFPLIAQLL